MKKYLIAVSTLIFIFIVYNFLSFNMGYYIPNDNKKINVLFKTEDKKILYKDKEYEIKGVNIGTSMPGLFTTDYNINEKTYLRWFKQISDMGANTIHVQTVINDEFYDALYKFNQNNKTPLFLYQGIIIESYPLNNRHDAYNNMYYNKLLDNTKIAIDVVHGRRKVLGNKSDISSGNFKKDISKWTIGYVINIEMDNNTIIYTNNKNKDLKEYNGKYIKTTNDATAYESLLGRVMDEMIKYETNKYSTQKLVSFENTPLTDPFDYSEEITYRFKKATKVDINHLNVTDKFKAGLITSYQAYSYNLDYFSVEKDPKYNDDDTYYAYLKKLNDYHKYPLVVTRFGYSTSRGRSGVTKNKHYNASGLTEEEQGKAIVKAYDVIKKAGSSGAFIDEWSDDNNKSAHNTRKKIDLTKLPLWHDVQSSASGKGLLKFESGKEKTIVTLDGSLDEWSKKNKVLENKDLKLYIKEDFKYLYFGIKLKDITNDERTVILLDTTNKSGSKYIEKYSIKANRGVDFVINIDGKHTQVLVQERYNNFKPIDFYEAYNLNPYKHTPKKDSNTFEKIFMLEQAFYKDLMGNYYEPILFETGRLKYGSTDKNNKDYNTQSDYYTKNDVIELRIPWSLLNFSDPTTLSIHDDYYEKFGVENLDLFNIYIDATRTKTAHLKKYKLKNVSNKDYHEELKDSYNIVKGRWSK